MTLRDDNLRLMTLWDDTFHVMTNKFDDRFANSFALVQRTLATQVALAKHFALVEDIFPFLNFSYLLNKPYIR